MTKEFKPQCANKPCLRIANGEGKILTKFCMACQDDASMNRLTNSNSPYTKINQMKNPTLPNIYTDGTNGKGYKGNYINKV
jgi:hypothetical protein